MTCSKCVLITTIQLASNEQGCLSGMKPGVPKKYIHTFKGHVDTLVNVAQAAVCRNQKCLNADGNQSEHLL
jgi:hypothetical protein